MTVARLSEIIARQDIPASWSDDTAAALTSLFGAEAGGRYDKKALEGFALRTPGQTGDSGVPYAALIHKDNQKSGPYAGTSLAIFPVEGAPCLITFVVGTSGISPDDEILGNPGHARKVQALCAWLNQKYGGGNVVAWAKHDPVRIDQPLPEGVRLQFQAYKSVFLKYGKELYGIYAPPNPEAIREPLTAFLDLMLEARGYEPREGETESRNSIQDQWFRHLLPDTSPDEVLALLEARRYVVIQGPPGTGKSRMAGELLADSYGGNGMSVQFHPNTTYESFVGGLQPRDASGGMGFKFTPSPGYLMNAVREAEKSNRPYLLHIDEINRADLAKVLGEAIYLLEAKADRPRTIGLSFDFGEPFGAELSLPDNLHILGTMNTADRSLAIVDVAVRRRFAFVNLWPQAAVVQKLGSPLANDAFARLVSIFVNHATGDAFNLVPGHSYFLENDDESLKRDLNVTLVPLLHEYIAQGYVAGFAEHIRGYLQWLDSL